MKRIIYLALIIFICITLFAGCGKCDSSSKNNISDDISKSNTYPTISDEESITGDIYEQEARGNTVGNISNNGFVAQYGEWIYYINQNDNGRLYKARTDGTEKIKLTNENLISNINVVGKLFHFRVRNPKAFAFPNLLYDKSKKYSYQFFRLTSILLWYQMKGFPQGCAPLK